MTMILLVLLFTTNIYAQSCKNMTDDQLTSFSKYSEYCSELPIGINMKLEISVFISPRTIDTSYNVHCGLVYRAASGFVERKIDMKFPSYNYTSQVIMTFPISEKCDNSADPSRAYTFHCNVKFLQIQYPAYVCVGTFKMTVLTWS